MKPQALFFAMTFLLLGQPWAAAQNRVAIGIVDQVEGPWSRANDDEVLARGVLLHAEDTVMTDSPESGFIAVMMFGTGTRWERHCSSQSPCRGTFRPPVPDDQRSGFWSFLSSYWSEGRRPSPIVFGSRSADEHGPRHGLAIRGPGGVRLDSLERMRPGKYVVTIMPAPDAASASSATPRVVSLDVARGEPVTLDVPAGLYLLSVDDERGERVGGNTLLLVLARSEPETERRWAHVQSTLQSWKANPATIDALIVRVLYALDAELKGS